MSSFTEFLDGYERFVSAIGRWQGVGSASSPTPITVELSARAEPLLPVALPAPAPTLSDLKRMKRELDHHPVPQCKRMREKLNAKKQTYADAMAAFRAQRAEA